MYGITLKAVSSASAILIENSIFIMPGYGYLSPHAIERIDFEGDQLANKEVIGNMVGRSMPVLFEVPPGYCV